MAVNWGYVFAASAALVCGCGGVGAPCSRSSLDRLTCDVTATLAGDGYDLRILLKNQRGNDVYAFVGSLYGFQDPELPFLYYTGGDTVTIFQGMMRRPLNFESAAPGEGSFVRRLSVGESVSYSVRLPRQVVEKPRYSALFSVPAHPAEIDYHDAPHFKCRTLIFAQGFWDVSPVVDQLIVKPSELEPPTALVQRVPGLLLLMPSGAVVAYSELPEAAAAKIRARVLIEQRRYPNKCDNIDLQKIREVVIHLPKPVDVERDHW